MRFPGTHRPGTRLARWARWLGLDRNPLRRPTDQVEAAIRLATMILLVVVVPLACIIVGQFAAHLAERQVRSQQAGERKVTAVLLQGVPAINTPDPYSVVQMSLVPARWQPPGQAPRSGQVLAPVGARAGSTETIWIDASGGFTTGPDPGLAGAAFCVAVVNTWLAAALTLLLCNGLARHFLERRRMSDWDAEWQATGPLWSGRR
jgi:hypothetical protein